MSTVDPTGRPVQSPGSDGQANDLILTGRLTLSGQAGQAYDLSISGRMTNPSGDSNQDFELGIDQQVESFLELRQKLSYFLITASIAVIAFSINYYTTNIRTDKALVHHVTARCSPQVRYPQLRQLDWLCSIFNSATCACRIRELDGFFGWNRKHEHPKRYKREAREPSHGVASSTMEVNTSRQMQQFGHNLHHGSHTGGYCRPWQSHARNQYVCRKESCRQAGRLKEHLLMLVHFMQITLAVPV